MPVILAIDASTRWAGVALSGAGEPVEITWRSEQNHGAELMLQVSSALRTAGISLADIECVAVALGPGGFSALRVGLATAKGLIAPTGTPLAGISTFDIEAMTHWPHAGPLVAMVDAGSSGIAWALYDSPRGGDSALPPECRSADGLSTARDLIEQAPMDAVFCGEPADALGDLVDETRILGTEPPTRRPLNLAVLAARRLELGDTDDPMTLEPDYARLPSITRKRRP